LYLIYFSYIFKTVFYCIPVCLQLMQLLEHPVTLHNETLIMHILTEDPANTFL